MSIVNGQHVWPALPGSPLGHVNAGARPLQPFHLADDHGTPRPSLHPSFPGSLSSHSHGQALSHSHHANPFLAQPFQSQPPSQPPIDSFASAAGSSLVPDPPSDADDDARRAHFADLFRRSEARVALLFSDDGSYNYTAINALRRPPTPVRPPLFPAATDHAPAQEPPRKKVKRVIDEDDYSDDDDDDDDEPDRNGHGHAGAPNLLHKAGSSAAAAAAAASAAAATTLPTPSKSGSSPVHSVPSPGKAADRMRDEGGLHHLQPRTQAKTTEDARKELEEARTATEEAAKRSFHTLIYPLEHDKMAMIEQQQLEESEKRLQAEMDKSGAQNATGPGGGPGAPNHGSLSSANLGASSLTLKHLIARIDIKRDRVPASDPELRLLINEVRKNRSKWASEDQIGQEELYEALDKVLSELKAHTEYSTPFLNKVNKRDAPDYYNIIKHPMDLGTMTKKLKTLQFKSKADFVNDLNLIWDNCLKYNGEMNHPLRRLANGMRREAEKLVPLIPDLVIRSRAEVEAEERRKQNGGDDDGGEDSDDEPIMSSRGRKATKGANKPRKTHTKEKEGTPTVDSKPVLQLNGILAKTNREGSEADGSNGFGTPPIAGSITPSGFNEVHSGVSNGDATELDGPSLNGMALGHELGDAAEQAFEDDEYQIWKQVTKRDRALLARERFQLFHGNRLNVDEPALLRTKAGMRRFLKARGQADVMSGQADAGDKDSVKPAEKTLAEGMEDEVDRNVPDYYEPQIVIPDIAPKLRWIEDGEGKVINQHEEFLRLVPRGQFVAPVSRLAKRFDANIQQIQETRKVCSKIGVIKQMQIQTQMYNQQFSRYNPEPFVELDAEPHFVCGEGPVMAANVCQSALRRSMAKIFYHAGFEELQPSALDAITEVAGDYFHKLVRTFNIYREAEKREVAGDDVVARTGSRFQPRFTPEEVILHTLHENGHEAETLEAYARDDIDRVGAKLTQIHERMRSHLADLLRPAVNGDNGPDGSGAFHDGSEQFVGGDFAEDLGEDFFGFKAMGLDRELGLDFLSVPLHLLHSRVRNQYQLTTATGAGPAGPASAFLMFENLPPSDPVTKDNIGDDIGLVRNFFLAKLHANGDQPLVEDEDLPVKQRRPRPRLGATGKIVSPQKRPPKEQIALAKKKKKLESGLAQITDGKGAAAAAAITTSTPEKNKRGRGGAAAGLAIPAGGVLAPPAASGSGGPIAGSGGAPGAATAGVQGGGNGLIPPHGASFSATQMERMDSVQSGTNASTTDKDDGVGMMSPESLGQR